uniref:non-specific serine/threonine protein kinase n=1 Tax=Oryza nivara TaxID=4536 RepID=A0A0E0FGL3_ORYNI
MVATRAGSPLNYVLKETFLYQGAFRRTRTRRKVERDDVQLSSRIDSLLQRLHDDRMVSETFPDRAPCRRLLALTGRIFSPAKTGGERRRGTGQQGVHDEPERMTAARPTLPLARSIMMTFQTKTLLMLSLHLLIPCSSAAATYTNHTRAISPAVPCLPDQAAALLQLKSSFSITNESMAAFDSWKAGEDCCRWEGVSCGDADGRVTWLDLGDCGLESGQLDPVLFKLTSLEYLNLGGNNFSLSEIPSTGFERLNHRMFFFFPIYRGSLDAIGGRKPVSKMISPKQQINILIFLLCSYAIHSDTAAQHDTAVHCRPDQASSLLRLKASFIGTNLLPSWRAGSDCCHWEGVTCDMASGRVISLDLSELNLISNRLDPALFNLTSLRNLSLAYNDFLGAALPASGFAQLTNMIHLNFSYSSFSGQIPIGIGSLKKLVTLDFSRNYGLYFVKPSFQTVMANLSNLRELHLDDVNILSSRSSWSVILADNTPQLEILSLSQCGISGSIHSSFSRLRSLKIIDLSVNWELNGKVPEFFAELSSLSILDISGNSFEGQFPTKIFHLKSLRTLDLSMNTDLSINLPEFLDGNNLETLSLTWTNLPYHTPSSFANLKSLKSLAISTTGTSKELLPSLIGELPSLKELEMWGSEWSLEKPVLSWVGNLKQLTDLTLGSYNFSQSTPSWIGNLTSLATLEMWGCNLSTSIPHQIGNLANLTSLRFEDCDFFGQKIPSWIGNFTKLRDLRIDNCGLSGPIPSTIGNLTQLEYLIIRSNDQLNGKIPQLLFTLSGLKYEVIGNQLSGSLEDIPSPLTSSLSSIDLSDNQLSGPIPKSFFQLTNLNYLNLGSNKFIGSVELSFVWKLKNLDLLSLSNNLISLIDDEGETILLASCKLTKIPGTLRYLDAISHLDLSSNQITGAIPSWIWENRTYQLKTLNLSHNMFTTVEQSPSLVNMTYLTYLDLSFNRLQGSIPIPVTASSEIALDYSNNHFSSIIPNFGIYLENASYINLSNNKLSGHLPSSICNASKAIIMDLSGNNYSGSVPACLTGSVNLSVLKLKDNQFHGVLPNNSREGCNLQSIDVNGNQIEGKLPRSLSYCQHLELLDVGNNQIVDSFPFWLGTLPNLRVLVLRSNKFIGTIRGLKGGYQNSDQFTRLQIIDLASNHLSGNIHSEWFEHFQSMMKNDNDEGEILEYDTKVNAKGSYQDITAVSYKGGMLTFTKILTTFKLIDLSDNSFGGPIPKSLQKLVLLRGLNMSYNALIGEIPPQLSSLTQVESLDLSWNKLSGEIPPELTSLTSLASLNLSYNNLTGRIPQGNQFGSFSNSSFEGNAYLCGKPLSKQCDTPGSTSRNASATSETSSFWQDKLGVILLFFFSGLGFTVGFILAVWFQSFFHIERWTHKH